MTSNSTTALSERPAEQSGPYVYLSGGGALAERGSTEREPSRQRRSQK